MKRLAVLAGVAGLLLLTVLVVAEGWAGIAAAFRRAGWPLLWLVPFHLVPLFFDTQAWRVLLEPINRSGQAGLWFLLWVASVREAVARLLPSVGIGGEMVGIRLVQLRLSDSTAIAAAIIVEVMVTITVLYVFSGLGLLLIVHLASELAHIWLIAASLLLTLPLPLLAYWLLRRGSVFASIQRLATRLLGRESQIALRLDGVGLDAQVAHLFGQPRRLLRALGWQFPGYLIGSFETWFALALLGHPVGATAAVAIEALTQATRHAAFLVPAGLGVQEAAVVLYGYLAGVGGDVALSLALVKRMRETLFGVPALLSWQWVEARLLRERRVGS